MVHIFFYSECLEMRKIILSRIEKKYEHNLPILKRPWKSGVSYFCKNGIKLFIQFLLKIQLKSQVPSRSQILAFQMDQPEAC